MKKFNMIPKIITKDKCIVVDAFWLDWCRGSVTVLWTQHHNHNWIARLKLKIKVAKGKRMNESLARCWRDACSMQCWCNENNTIHTSRNVVYQFVLVLFLIALHQSFVMDALQLSYCAVIYRKYQRCLCISSAYVALFFHQATVSAVNWRFM